MYLKSYLSILNTARMVLLASMAAHKSAKANEVTKQPISPAGTPFSMVAYPTEIALVARDLEQASFTTAWMWPVTTQLDYVSQSLSSPLTTAPTVLSTTSTPPTSIPSSTPTPTPSSTLQAVPNASQNKNQGEVISSWVVGGFFILCIIGAIIALLRRRYTEYRAAQNPGEDMEAIQVDEYGRVLYAPMPPLELTTYRSFSFEAMHGR